MILNLTQTSVAGELVLAVEGKRLDAENASLFKTRLMEICRAGDSLPIVDISEVAFIDSTGLGALLSCHKALEDRGGLVLACPGQEVARLFALTRMNRVMGVFASVDQAVASVRAWRRKTAVRPDSAAGP
ncbi:MAG: STAS domain-containing protein [Desulfovibrionaceae bacterium]|nr:STAS domain-containing protein [Desulfovibrionaceae bacterium]MDD4952889.1 STAS domain-containing protein [Desulfovibrionaceae bacterium]